MKQLTVIALVLLACLPISTGAADRTAADNPLSFDIANIKRGRAHYTASGHEVVVGARGWFDVEDWARCTG